MTVPESRQGNRPSSKNENISATATKTKELSGE